MEVFFGVCVGLSFLMVVFGLVTGRLEFHNPFEVVRSDRIRTIFPNAMSKWASSESMWKTSTVYRHVGKDGIERDMTEEEIGVLDQRVKEMEVELRELDDALDVTMKDLDEKVNTMFK